MKTIALAVTALLISVLLAVSQSLLPSPVQAQVPIVQKDAGLEFEGFGTPNTARIVDTIYQGECSGEEKGEVKARFYSTATPPGSGRRVVIRNVSRGLSDDSVPFTDRDYSQGRTSESTTVEFGTKHELTHFVMLEGQNSLEYEIKQGDNPIDRGSFTAQISRDERDRTRNAICSEERYCSDSKDTPLDKCKRVRVRDRCFCSNALGKDFFRNYRDE